MAKRAKKNTKMTVPVTVDIEIDVEVIQQIANDRFYDELYYGESDLLTAARKKAIIKEMLKDENLVSTIEETYRKRLLATV